MNIVVTVPNFIDPREFEAKIVALTEELIQKNDAMQREVSRSIAILKNQEDFEKWARFNFFGRETAVARANNYSRVEDYQEFYHQPWWIYRDKIAPNLFARRPIFMRGSLGAIEEKYSPRGLNPKEPASRVARRYLSMTKFTALTQAKCQRTEVELTRRLREKGFYVGHGLQIFGPGNWIMENYKDLSWVWLAGKYEGIPLAKYKDMLFKANEYSKLSMISKSEAERKKAQWLDNLEKSEQMLRKVKRGKRAQEIAAFELLKELENA